MDNLSASEVDEQEVLTRSALQGLYAVGTIETLHVVSGAVGVTVKAFIAGEEGPRELALPEGNYLIGRVVERPTATPGLFGVRAPGGPRCRKSRGQAPKV